MNEEFLKSMGLDPTLLSEEDTIKLESVSRQIGNNPNMNPNRILRLLNEVGINPQKLVSKMRGNDGPKISTRIGRNEKCPCMSGKKYKKCCGGYKKS